VRVTFLTHYYPPELGAAPARIAALAHGLAAEGLEVTVHTGFPHYPSGTIPPPHRNRPLVVERGGPVRVVRSFVYPSANRGFTRRLADHTVFAAGALATSRAVGPADVVVAESPPLFTAAAGVAYARLKRAALVLNISDLWPESAIELGALRPGGGAAAAAGALARLCYRQAALLTAPTVGIVRALEDRAESRGKVRQVPPAVDLERFAAVPPRTPAALVALGGGTSQAERSLPERPLRVLYAGTLGIAQDLQNLIEAAELAGPAAVELTIAGEGPEHERLGALVQARGLAHVHLLGGVPPEQIPLLYGDADAGVVSLRDLPVFAGALPTKLFEVLAAGRPAIVAARGEAAELVRGTRAGLVVAPEDPEALAGAFRHLRSAPAEAIAMGTRGRERAHDYGRAAVVAQWHSLLTGLAVPRP
jgi:colanic acid biosynthesis glycosyl transferase WcaI